MKPFAKNLLAELNQQLKTTHSEFKKPLQYCEPAIKTSLTILEKLQTHVTEHQFKNESEEIEFFKTIKPKFTAKLLYYNHIYHIESTKISGAKKHYRSHLKKINKHEKRNAEIGKYLKSGNTYLDQLYFLRDNTTFRLTLKKNIPSDYKFTTAHDNTVALSKAHKAVKKYLKAKLRKKKKNQSKKQSPLTWTAPKTALIELLYALHSAQPFNNGNTSLNQIAQTFETLFNIKLGQYHRTYYEICARKTIDPAHFLNTLKEKLTNRIAQTDAK